ncbi:MAG: phage head closure protein [Robiginitomaculum sp.]|nr:phage head closure protein [Robiginitomaculum sp.]
MSLLRELSERVALQTLETVDDNSGGRSATWVAMANVWAEVRPASATNGTRIGGTTTRRFVKIFIRERSDIALPLQVIWGGSTLRVLAFRDAPNSRIELECEEVLQ